MRRRFRSGGGGVRAGTAFIVAAMAAGAAVMASSACMPWAVGQTAETVPPGDVEAGLAATAISPPTAPAGALVSPQAWARTGALDDLDLGLTYAVPLTFQADARFRFRTRPGYAVAALAGAGVHGTPVPERLGLGPRRAIWTPFALAGLVASARGDATPRPYAAVRAFAPFATGETFAMTAWGVVSAGMEWSRGTLRLTPELGAIVPASHPGDALVSVGIGMRWVPPRP